MRRAAIILRLFAVLSLGLWLVGAAAVTVRAQDDAEPTATSEGEAPTAEPTSAAAAVAQGTLQIAVFTCTSGPEGVSGAVYGPGDFTPDESCTQGGTASVSIDGGDAQDVNDGDQFPLDAGDHTVDETSINAPVTATIAADETTTVSIVFYSVAAQAAVGSISIVKHICPASVTDDTTFDALGDFYAKALACPTITLPNNVGPEGSKNGNDPDNPLSFDFTVTDANGSAGIDTADFNPEQICESDLGQDLNGDPNDNLCLDESTYTYADVVQGTVTVTETTPLDGYQYGAYEFVPGSGEDSTFVSETAETGELGLDTTGAESVTLHVFNFVKPAQNRINIVKHQCDASVTTQSEFDALGGYYAKLLACPVVLRGDDTAFPGAITGGHRTFAFDVQGADDQVQTLDDATFVQAKICENDLGQDFDGDPNTNVCLDASHYQFDNVQQGPDVTITETKSPRGYQFGAVEFDPNGNDEATVTDVSNGVIQLDTTNDGDVTVQIFNLAKPATPTPTPTATATATATTTATSTPAATSTAEPSAPVGTLQILKFYCIGDSESTEIYPLAPGEEANLDDYLDDTCVAGGASFLISAYGTDVLGTYTVGEDGQLSVTDLPVTTADTGQHLITETYSLQSAGFDIAQGEVTRVIVLNFEPDATVDSAVSDASSTDGEDTTDENNVASGDDLPDTGIGPMNGPVDGGAVLMLGAMGLMLLAAAATLRKRSA